MAETGLSLVVSKEMLANLQKADNAITNLATKSEQAKNHIVSAFTEMSDKGVGAFIRKLNEAQNKLASFNNIKIQGADFSQFTNNTTQAIDAINKLIATNNKLNSNKGEKKGVVSALGDVKEWQNLQQQITQTDEKIKQLKRSTDQYERVTKNINEGRGGVLQAGATKEYQQNKETIQILQQQITLWRDRQQQIINNNQAIQQQINFVNNLREYVKSLNSLPNQRSNATLQAMREFYREEEKQIQKNARLKEKEDAKVRREQEQNAKNAAKAEEQRIKQESSMRRRDYERYISTQDTYSHAMSVSNRAKTLNQELRAIKALEQARGNLNKTDSQYEAKLLRLNAAIRQHKQNIDRATQSGKNLQSSHRGLMNISEQLQRRIALVFSVSQITGYVNKLIQVRGEFELQQRALQAILQNRDEANKLWEKTVQLAVQSPFQVKELVTYTKQLAAYRVESDKLYDTTKMLADVSAGLGVDMQRLILAFGQVKAANYLRGTELRQFSEAGINILGELATYFTELEGITVSVGEVFERVSKRMVTFGDVEEVFKRLTSAGGTFYRMQEIQAETLRGQISNLKDSIDIMLNEVGKANEQTLKNSVALVRNFVESWERIVDILQAAGAAFIVVTAARVKDAIAAKAWSAANIAATASATGLNAVLARTIISLKALWAALLNNPITAAIAGLTALGVVLYKVAKRNAEANKALQESANKLAMQRIESEKYTNILTTLVKKQNELVEANKSLSKESSQYKDNISKINELEQDRKNILNSLESVDATYAKSLREIGTDTEKLTEKTSLYNEELRVRIALEKDLQNISSEDFIKDYNTVIAKLNTNAARVETTYANTIAKVEQLLNMPIGDGAKKIFRDFLNSSEPYVDRVTKLYETLSYNFRGLMGNFDFKDVQAYIKSIEEVDEITKKVVDDISKTATTYKATPLGTSLIGVITNAEATDKDKENAKNNIIATFEKILDDKAITGYLRTKAQETLSNIFNFKWEKINTTKPLEEWKVAYNNFIATLDQEKGAKIAPASLDTTLEQLRSDIDSQIAALEKSITAYNKANKKLKNALKASFEKDTATLANLKKQRDFLGYNPKETTSGDKDNTWTNLMRVVKEVSTEFKNLNKTFDKTTALQGTLAKYSDALTTAFKGTGKAFTDFDFTTESGLIEFYDWLIKVIPEVDKLKAQLAKGEVVWDVRINKKELEDKAFLDQIEEMFSGYEVSLELQKLNIPPDLAKQLFNVDSLTLPELKEQVLRLRPEFEGKDMLDKWDELMKRINKMETKAQEERLKKYTKYLVKAQGERVKIKLEELRAINEIESLNFTDAQKDLAKQAVRKETQQKFDKLEWEDFKESGMYVQLFEDLEYASTSALKKMRERLLELKTQLSELDADDLRNLYNQVDKLDDELATRNPYAAFITGAKDYIDALKQSKVVEEQLDTQYSTTRTLKRQEASVEGQLAKEKALYEQMSKNGSISQKDLSNQRLKINFLNTQLSAIKAQLLAQGKLTKELEEQLDALKTTRKTFEGSLSDIGSDITQIASVLPEVAGDLENVFGSMSAGMKDAIDSVSAIAGGVGDAISGFASGNYIQAIAGVVKAIGGIAAIGDKKREREIQKEIKFIEDLEKSYEKLEKAIENAYDVDTLKKAFDNANKNIDQEIAALEKAIKLEEDKKKPDSDKIKEWEEQIDALKEKRDELLKEQVENLGGSYDFDSITEEFVNAWLDAFKETQDGLSGLEENFAEFWQNIAIKQAIMGGASKILEPFLNEVNKALENDFTITDSEMASIDAKGEEAKAKLDAFLEQWYSRWGDMIGDTEQGELSGLQRGIQSVTEETAQALESLLNSTRFFVADSNTKLTLLVDSFTNPESANPILSELRSQSEMIRAIRDMFSSVIGRGHDTYGGAFLKVAL